MAPLPPRSDPPLQVPGFEEAVNSEAGHAVGRSCINYVPFGRLGLLLGLCQVQFFFESRSEASWRSRHHQIVIWELDANL